MRDRSTSTGGRHRAPATDTSRPTTAGRSARQAAPGGAGSAAGGNGRRAARIAAAEVRAERKHHLIAVASAASLGLVSSFMLALPANAAEPLPADPAVSSGTAPGQSLAVSDSAELPAVQQSTFGASGGTGEVGVTTTGGQTNASWAQLVLQDGGWPTSANNITVILQWMDSENSPQSWWLRNNPLNNGYGSGGGAGFGSYPSLLVAAQDVAVNLQRNSGYSAIVSSLAASAPVQTTAEAIEDSPWAGSHYGYGSLWHAVDVPIVTAPASDW